MFSHRNTRCALLGVVGLLAAGLAGCGGGTSLSKPFGTDPNDTNQQRTFNALVGSPGSGVNITQRSVSLNPSPLSFGQGTSYATVSSGIAIKTDAIQAGTATLVAPETTVSMTRDFSYTQVVSGVFGTSGTTAPRLIQFTDNFPGTIASSTAVVRLVNLLPDSPPISLYNIAGFPPTAIAVMGLGGIAYGSTSGTSGSAYVAVTAGNYNLSIRDSAGNVLTSLGAATLAGGHAYSIFVFGLVSPAAGQPSAQSLLLTDK